MPVRIEVGSADAQGEADERARSLIESAASATLRDRGVADAELSITLIDDETMTSMNRQWKGADGPTDVLAFTLGGEEEGDALVGDIYIGVDQVGRQAAEYGEEPDRELARVAIHATLHVLGWDHPEQDREGSEMWGHQERILQEIERA